jgi:hypothetical protein
MDHQATFDPAILFFTTPTIAGHPATNHLADERTDIYIPGG